MKRREVTVSELMSTALITVKVSDTITEAHAEMALGVVRHLPVIDDRRRLVGVLSDRDVQRAIAGKKAHRVSEIMVSDMTTIEPEAPAHAAVTLMLEQQIGSVLVIDDAGTLVGVVTQTDYLELARRALLGLSLERS